MRYPKNKDVFAVWIGTVNGKCRAIEFFVVGVRSAEKVPRVERETWREHAKVVLVVLPG